MEPEAGRIGVMLALAHELAGMETTRANLDRATQLLVALSREARQVDPRYAATRPQVPWILLISGGDILIRAGADVDAAEIWATITQDLPELQRRLSQAAGATG